VILIAREIQVPLLGFLLLHFPGGDLSFSRSGFACFLGSLDLFSRRSVAVEDGASRSVVLLKVFIFHPPASCTISVFVCQYLLFLFSGFCAGARRFRPCFHPARSGERSGPSLIFLRFALRCAQRRRLLVVFLPIFSLRFREAPRCSSPLSRLHLNVLQFGFEKISAALPRPGTLVLIKFKRCSGASECHISGFFFFLRDLLFPSPFSAPPKLKFYSRACPAWRVIAMRCFVLNVKVYTAELCRLFDVLCLGLPSLFFPSDSPSPCPSPS